jgi:hypothetical protein
VRTVLYGVGTIVALFGTGFLIGVSPQLDLNPSVGWV